MKKLICILLSISTLVVSCIYTYADDNTKKPAILSMEINDVHFDFIDTEDYDKEAFPEAFDGILVRENSQVLLVPLRTVAEKAGYTVAWDEKEQQVTVEQNNIKAIFEIGKSYATVNDNRINADAEIRIINDRTYVSSMLAVKALDNFHSETTSDNTVSD